MDPLKWGQELVVIAIILVAFAFICAYKEKIIFFLTGDTKIHADCLDCIYACCCRCCNTCDGEWTRYFFSCPCCPSFLYKRNFVKEFARCFGLNKTTIEVKNIVIGDLPYFQQQGDFYLSVAVGTNPDMVTALQEGKHPKVIHFPEVLQLKVRHNALEPRVHFVVKELNVIGSELLCELVLSANAMIDWMNDTERPMKRFQMRPLNTDIELETPPWICMEFSKPTENRLLDDLIQLNTASLEVRTWEKTKDGHTGPKGKNTLKSVDGSWIQQAGGALTHERELQTRSIADMKGLYTLLDDSGNPIQEPDEHMLNWIACQRNCCLCIYHLINFLVFIAVVSYCSFRFYVWSCYRQFRFLTMAILNQQTIPISNAHLKDIVDQCHAKVRGTGIAEGDPCRPNANQTLYVCGHLPHENRPEAFRTLIYDWFGADIKGIGCFNGLCKFRDDLVEYDHICAAIAIGLVLFTCVCRCCINQYIKEVRKAAQRKQGDEIMKTKAASSGRSRTGGTSTTH